MTENHKHENSLNELLIRVVSVKLIAMCSSQGPSFRPSVSLLSFDATRQSSFFRSQSFSKHLVGGSVATLIRQATSFEAMGTLEQSAALPTSSTS